MRWTRAGWTAKVNLVASEAHGHPLHAPGEKASNQIRSCSQAPRLSRCWLWGSSSSRALRRDLLLPHQ